MLIPFKYVSRLFQFVTEKQKTPLRETDLCKGRTVFAVPPFFASFHVGKSLLGHSHVPSAVTGGPVTPTRCRQARVFRVRLSEGIHSGLVAVIPPSTALLTRSIRPTGFRSTSILQYYNGLSGICQGGLQKIRGIFTKNGLEILSCYGLTGGGGECDIISKAARRGRFV